MSRRQARPALRIAAWLVAGVVLGGPASALAATGEPVHVGGDVLAPELISKVEPEYPKPAREGRIFGNVILEAVIDTEGRVTELQVVKSIPLLDDAAIAAVRQWRYKPATRQGRPVDVYHSIAVSFSPEGPAAAQRPATPDAQADEPLIVTGDVRPPEIVTKVEPQYSEEARREHVEGRVALQLIIDAEGNVESAAVLRSIPLLDDAAIAAVKQWKYRPATKSGLPVRVRFVVMIDFKLG